LLKKIIHNNNFSLHTYSSTFYWVSVSVFSGYYFSGSFVLSTYSDSYTDFDFDKI